MESNRHGTGGGAAVRGLRLVTMNRGKDGFGFHMYTNKDRDGQYIKSVTRDSPSDLAGMLTGDHIIAVDGHMVIKDTHHQVGITTLNGCSYNNNRFLHSLENKK